MVLRGLLDTAPPGSVALAALHQRQVQDLFVALQVVRVAQAVLRAIDFVVPRSFRRRRCKPCAAVRVATGGTSRSAKGAEARPSPGHRPTVPGQRRSTRKGRSARWRLRARWQPAGCVAGAPARWAALSAPHRRPRVTGSRTPRVPAACVQGRRGDRHRRSLLQATRRRKPRTAPSNSPPANGSGLTPCVRPSPRPAPSARR